MARPTPALTASFTGLVNGDTPSAISGLTLTASGTNAGSYAIIPSGAADANYAIRYADGTLTIDPAVLSVAADNESAPQGQPDPPLAFTYAGLVNGDNSGVFRGTLTTPANIDSPAGTYAISRGSLSAGENYLIDYVAGTLTVTRAEQTAVQTLTPAADSTSIISTLGQANNYINPTLIMDRDINLVSIIYLGNALPIPFASAAPAAGEGWKEIDSGATLPQRFAITSRSFVGCDGEHDGAIRSLCGEISPVTAVLPRALKPAKR